MNKKLKQCCNICFGEVSDPLICSECIFQCCKECIITWSKKTTTCPQCRENKTYDIEYEYSSDIEYEYEEYEEYEESEEYEERGEREEIEEGEEIEEIEEGEESDERVLMFYEVES